MGLGVNRGHGFLISYDKGSGKWSAPCFITYTSAKAGAVLGVEKVRFAVARVYWVPPARSPDLWQCGHSATVRGCKPDCKVWLMFIDRQSDWRA